MIKKITKHNSAFFVKCENCDEKATTNTIENILEAKHKVRYWCLECRQNLQDKFDKDE